MTKLLFTFAQSQSQSSRLSSIVVTLGKHGVFYAASASHVGKLYPSVQVDPSHIKSAVGSGDSFMGGYIYGLVQGKDADKCIQYGQVCAAKSLQSERNVSSEINSSILNH